MYLKIVQDVAWAIANLLSTPSKCGTPIFMSSFHQIKFLRTGERILPKCHSFFFNQFKFIYS